ncbi:MAG: hypothetical protein IPL43_00190 [Micropruina sp.]|nr:hypothetical protein [Micropruina sp.]
MAGDPQGRLSRALGHVRNASAALLAGSDGADTALLLGLACLDLEDLFAELEVVPAFIAADLSPAGCIEEAMGLVEVEPDEVSVAIWAALLALRTRLR